MTADAVRGSPAERRKDQVRSRYAAVATGRACCGTVAEAGTCCGDSCCSTQPGYATEELAHLPPGADLGLGCGNPAARASLRPGEVVLDLGSGAGIDCFLASRRVGPGGRVIGVDMTPEMLSRARAIARSGRYRNVEFRLGEIDHLPVPDRSVDVVLSNCVINLVPDKAAAYREAFRVLRPGGRLAIADVVATRPIASKERSDPSRWVSCSAGAIEVSRLRRLLRSVGFSRVAVELAPAARAPDGHRKPASVGAAHIRAVKPSR